MSFLYLSIYLLLFLVGRDFAGEVVRVGQNVSNVKVNDRVWGVVLPQQQGSHAEYVVTESFNVSSNFQTCLFSSNACYKQ